jgi:hypothetical protein
MMEGVESTPSKSRLTAKKNGRESFLDSIATVSVEDPPCPASRASLLETSPTMS